MTTLFTGYYNTAFIEQNPVNGLLSLPAFLDKYPNALTILEVSSNRLLPVVTAPNTPLFYENFTWATYEDATFKNKLGEMTYDCLYPDTGSGIISAPSIQQMVVLGAQGIYAGVNKIIMDFTTPPIRTIKFIYES
jgi:hypothetical protein